MFFGPNEEPSFTIVGGQRFSIVLPFMTEEIYPKKAIQYSYASLFRRWRN